MGTLGGRKSQLVRYDPISFSLVVLSVVLLLFIARFGLELAILGLIFVAVALSGMVFSIARGYHKIEQRPINARVAIFWISLSIGVIFLLNQLTVALQGSILPLVHIPLFEPLAAAPLEARRIIVLLAAISEESLFRGFLTPWFAQRLGQPNLAAILAGGVFAIFHLGLFPSSTIVIVVFGTGTLLSIAALRTGRLSFVMFAHLFNNFLAEV